jgi:serine phosphatase RsbU (regulator of sigma subunit)/anti-sigma regulatory factor (Ser/Thr protein kinase)/HAMP domain-containing protein
MVSFRSDKGLRVTNSWRNLSALIVITAYCLLFFSTVMFFSAVNGQVRQLVMREARTSQANSGKIAAEQALLIIQGKIADNADFDSSEISPKIITETGNDLAGLFTKINGDILIFRTDGRLEYPRNGSMNADMLLESGLGKWLADINQVYDENPLDLHKNKTDYNVNLDKKNLTVTPIGKTGLALGLLSDQASLISKANRFESSLFATLIITFGVVIILFLMLLRLILSPLKILIQAVERIGSGQLETRVKVDSRNEIGNLCGAFNSMAEDLQSKYSEIEMYSQKLEDMNADAQHTMQILGKRNRELALINKLSYETGRNFSFQENLEFLAGRILDEHLPLFVETFTEDTRLKQWHCSQCSFMDPDKFVMTMDFNELLTKVSEKGKVRKIKGSVHPPFMHENVDPAELIIFPIELNLDSNLVVVIGEKEKGSFSTRDIQFLCNLIRHAGIIFHNVQLYETSLHRSEILEKINIIGQAILSELNIDKLIPRVIRELKTLLNVGRVLIIYSDQKNNIYMNYVLDEEWKIKPFDEMNRDEYCQDILKSNQPLLEQNDSDVEDWIWDLYGEEYRSFLGIPLASGECQGLLGLYAFEPGFFSSEDVRFITTFANYLASALANARLFSEINEREKTRTEQLEVAKKFQSDRIPYLFEQGKLELECALVPAMELAGDFFDVFSLGQKSVGVVIGDVATKGIPASLMTFSILSLFRNAAKSLTPPNKVMQLVNQGLISQIKEQSWFATAFYARIHTDDLIMTYSKAGHVLPILYRKRTGECIPLDVDGIPLGILEDGLFQTGQIKLEEGDRLVLYTDGVTELRISDYEFFGQQRLIDVIRQDGAKSVGELKDSIFGSIENIGDSRFKRDDILVAVMGIKSNPWISRIIKYTETSDLIEEIMEQVTQYDLPKNVVYAVRLSLNETLANAHKHGNRGDESLNIFVNYIIANGVFSMSVKDEGYGFDHEALPDPTVEENLLLPHGRGIFLMRSMMDEVEFNETGNSIKVTKLLPEKQSEEERDLCDFELAFL